MIGSQSRQARCQWGDDCFLDPQMATPQKGFQIAKRGGLGAHKMQIKPDDRPVHAARITKTCGGIDPEAQRHGMDQLVTRLAQNGVLLIVQFADFKIANRTRSQRQFNRVGF